MAIKLKRNVENILRKKLTSFDLKIIAILAMTINHIGFIFKDIYNPLWWQIIYLTIGKITFPIMAYLLNLGFQKTKSKTQYIIRLGIYALISIIPYHYTIGINTDATIYPLNNILFTLIIGLLLITILDKLKPSKMMQVLFLIIASALTFNSDWNIIGVLIIYFFYKDSKIESKTLIIIATTTSIINFIATLDITSFTYLGIILSIPILKNTNDERGYSNNLIKHGFYIYYPLHLSVLFILHLLINR